MIEPAPSCFGRVVGGAAGLGGRGVGVHEADRGAAAFMALLVLLLMASVTAAFTALATVDTQVRSLDNTRTQTFYAVHAGLEKLTADLGDLFAQNVAPTANQVQALANSPPAIAGITWTDTNGASGYRVVYPTGPSGNPSASLMSVESGPFQGLIGMATPYTVTVTGHNRDMTEASFTRTLQTIAIPVFQFGIMSESDLSFFAGPPFDFGGRVHANGNIFLASGVSSSVTLSDRVSAAGEIIRTNLANGYTTAVEYVGAVLASTAPGVYRNLAQNEGSLVGTLGSAQNEPMWTNLSTGEYNHNLTSRLTGGRRLNPPVSQAGGTPIDIIRRPQPNEPATAPGLFAERYFGFASVRILLSDSVASIASLPGVTTAPPVALGINEPYVVSASPARPPFAQTPNVGGVTGVRVPVNTPLLGGYLKIEKQNSAGVWSDVTAEILALGISSPALTSSAPGATACTDYTPDAVLRVQRLLDNAGLCPTLTEATTDVAAPWQYVPNVLFDPREGQQRDAALASMQLGGIVHYIELDVRNLTRWLQGSIGTTGLLARRDGGVTVYFSDRRGNRNGAGQETGELGFEDVVNPASGTGAPNGTLDLGEDANANGALDTYGNVARLPFGVPDWSGVSAPLAPSATLTTEVGMTDAVEIARRNPPLFFRRALKLTNGAAGNIIAPGLTVASENPVYVQGNWNADSMGFGGPHVATSVLADAVTLLSGNWNDLNSLMNPYTKDSTSMRTAVTTFYRFAVAAGKGLSFPRPAGAGVDFGTDGGVHNFLRYIEDWGSATLNYRGSLISLFSSRQAIGTFKCCGIVYSPPTRNYAFDTDFLTPALLPPHTPMMKDVNITGFVQVIRP